MRFQDAWKLLDISNDDFIRTTEPRHYAAVEQLLQACYDNGDIELDTYEGLYCVSCEATTPSADLVDGNCPIHGRTGRATSRRRTTSSGCRATSRPLLDWYEQHPDFVQPDSQAQRGARLHPLGAAGLLDHAARRSRGACPMPWDARHVTYVWFDALTNYITAVGYGTDQTSGSSSGGRRTHLIGKDILRFHCVYWPAMLLSAGLDRRPSTCTCTASSSSAARR